MFRLSYSWSGPFVIDGFITGFVTRSTCLKPGVKQELLTLPVHLISHSVFSGVRVARSLVFCVVFVASLFSDLMFFLTLLLLINVNGILLTFKTVLF
jgi:hypothetical protein